jgi:uncharacterized protein (UPF0332 family)
LTPEAEAMMETAQKHLEEGHSILTIRLWGQVGRSGYMAALTAARAYIFETTGQVVKTHRGTHNTFYRLIAGDSRFDSELRRFLSMAYGLKDVAGYGIGPDRAVPEERAREALDTATRFVAHVAEILTEPQPL